MSEVMYFLLLTFMSGYTLLHACANTSGWTTPKVTSSSHVSGTVIATAVVKKCAECKRRNIIITPEDPNNVHSLTPILSKVTTDSSGCAQLHATCDATAFIGSVTFMTFNFGQVTPNLNGISSVTANLNCTSSGWQYIDEWGAPTNVSEISCWKS